MLKLMITAGMLAIAGPAVAQTAQDPQQAMPKTAVPAPTTAAPAQDSRLTPGADATAAQPAAAQADPAATAKPATGDAVAQVVDAGWATYDANGDGKLSLTEFSAWMNKVKADSDAKLDLASPAMRKWNQGAFAQADTDKSKSVSKAELTAFLSKGQKAS